jgi:hypothetical protein
MSSSVRHYDDPEREIAYRGKIIAGLERRVELLRKRCGNYARQRRAAIDVLGACSPTPIAAASGGPQASDIDVGLTLPAVGSHLETTWSENGYWTIDEVDKDRTMFTNVGHVYRQEDAETICRAVNKLARERDEWWTTMEHLDRCVNESCRCHQDI